MKDNKIIFRIQDNLFEVECNDCDLLRAAILEFTATYTFPVIFEDSILYAPFEADRDQLFMKYGGYRRFLEKQTSKVKEVIQTIKKISYEYIGHDACAA